MHKEFKETLIALYECAAACNHCYSACLQEQHIKMLSRCIQLDRDCSDICHLTAKLLQSGSEVSRETLRLCITICEACADECERHSKMEHCKECAAACRKCVEECSRALGAAPGMRAIQ